VEDEGVTIVEAVGYYRVGPHEVYVDENQVLAGYPYHIVKLMIICPVEYIDEEHFSRTARNYEIELETEIADFKEEREIFSADGDKIRTPFTEEGIRLVNEGGTTEEIRHHYEEYAKAKELATAFGYRGFTQARFHEAMVILGQLDPRERLPDPLTTGIG